MKQTDILMEYWYIHHRIFSLLLIQIPTCVSKIGISSLITKIWLIPIWPKQIQYTCFLNLPLSYPNSILGLLQFANFRAQQGKFLTIPLPAVCLAQEVAKVGMWV